MTDLAPGCCSAISPCSHQQRDPYSICDICAQAGRPRTASAPEEVERVIAEWTEAAKGVTPGEWLYCMYGTVVFKLQTMTPKGDLGFIATTIDDRLDEDDVDYPTTEARARWIARCSPDGIRSLLALITQQAQALADANARIRAMEGALAWQSDPKERISRDRDIILEAINTYDEWMLDDDYDADTILRNIIDRMRDRAAPEQGGEK